MAISLTPLSRDDAAALLPLWSDREATRFTNFPHLPTLAACEAQLAKMIAHYAREPRHFGPYAVRLDDGTLVGLVGADATPAEGCYELWYFVARAHWRRGIATTAIAELSRRMAQSGQVRALVAEAVVENVPSWTLLERLGFRRELLLPGAHQKEGEVFDRYRYRREL